MSTKRAKPGPVGINLRRLMEERGLGPTALARLSGVPRSTINGLLSGYSPRPSDDTAERLSKALEITRDELVRDPSGLEQLDEAIQAFEASTFAALLKPPLDNQDRAFLGRVGPVFWVGARPNPEAILHLVLAYRAGRLD